MTWLRRRREAKKSPRCVECGHRQGAHHPHHCDGFTGQTVLRGGLRPCRCTSHKFLPTTPRRERAA